MRFLRKLNMIATYIQDQSLDQGHHARTTKPWCTPSHKRGGQQVTAVAAGDISWYQEISSLGQPPLSYSWGFSIFIKHIKCYQSLSNCINVNQCFSMLNFCDGLPSAPVRDLRCSMSDSRPFSRPRLERVRPGSSDTKWRWTNWKRMKKPNSFNRQLLAFKQIVTLFIFLVSIFVPGCWFQWFQSTKIISWWLETTN